MFVATINVPGYLPMDDEPPVFETAHAAWEYLASERREAEDWPRDDFTVTGDLASETLEALHFHATSAEVTTGTVYGPTPDSHSEHDLGLAYSVSVAEDELPYECPDCGDRHDGETTGTERCPSCESD